MKSWYVWYARKQLSQRLRQLFPCIPTSRLLEPEARLPELAVATEGNGGHEAFGLEGADGMAMVGVADPNSAKPTLGVVAGDRV